MAKQSKKKTRGKQKAPTPPPSRWAAHRPLFERIFFVVALMGVLVTAHFNLTASTGFEQECLFGAFESPVETSGCQAALESAVGRPLGVSNAVWGMLFYLVVAGLCAAIVFGTEARRIFLKRARAVLVGLGFFYSMFLTAYQFVAMPARCPLCLISALLVTVLLGVQVLYLVQPVDLSTMTMKAKKKVREGALYGALAVMMLLFAGADAAYFNNLVEPAAAQTTLTASTPVTPPIAASDDAGSAENDCPYDPEKAPIEDFGALVGEKDPFKG
ncbi:MAG: vitamin K epoxide reductase family protein, partial [Rhodothermales bacterium]